MMICFNRLFVLLCLILLFINCSKQDAVISKNKQIWKFTFSDAKWDDNDFSSYYHNEKPYIWNDYIMFGNNTIFLHSSTKKGFFVMNKKTGTPVYQYHKGDTRFVLVGDTVYIGADRLFALDLNSLTEKWSVQEKNAKYPPFHTQRRVYIVMKGNKGILGFNSRNGKKVFSIREPEKINRLIEVNRKSKVLYYSNGLVLNAIDLRIKRQVWKKTGTDIFFFEPTLYNNYLIVFGGKRSENGNVLSALNAKTGKLYWDLPDGVERFLSGPRPVFYKEAMYISGKRALTCVDIKKGKIVWQVKYHLTFALPVNIIADNLYYPVFEENKIQQYDLHTGKLIKEITLNNKITSPFTYENGIVYYCSENTLFAEKVEL